DRPHGAPGHARGLLAGDRPRRPRRQAEPRRPPALLERPPDPRVLPRAQLSRPGRSRADLPRARARAAPGRRPRAEAGPGRRAARAGPREAWDPRGTALPPRARPPAGRAGARRLGGAVPPPARAPPRPARSRAAVRRRPRLPDDGARAPLR